MFAAEGAAGVAPQEKTLKLSGEQMREVIVLPEEKVHEFIEHPPDFNVIPTCRCQVTVSGQDSFAAALSMVKGSTGNDTSQKILVLNFANPVEPGGGVRRGARAQEEDLCRKSTLLASLESKQAQAYYAYNAACGGSLFFDAMLLSPTVEVFRGKQNALLEESVVVSVLTVAAPYVANGLRGLSREALEEAIYRRIQGMLYVMAAYRYREIVLGAWGCGAFGNDAEMIARLFYKALKEIRCGEYSNANALFDRIEFAVSHNLQNTYNYDCFQKQFQEFQHE